MKNNQIDDSLSPISDAWGCAISVAAMNDVVDMPRAIMGKMIMPDAVMRDCMEAEERMLKNHNKIMKHLKRSLKPKLWEAIELELSKHSDYMAHGIVRINDVAGTKVSKRQWGAASSALRHVYQDLHGSSGMMWIPLGKCRYLEVRVNGNSPLV